MKTRSPMFFGSLFMRIATAVLLTFLVVSPTKAVNIKPVRTSGELVVSPCSVQDNSSNRDSTIQTDTAILFVHGIGGHPESTFTSSSILSDCEKRTDTLLNDALMFFKLRQPMQYMTLFELVHKDEASSLSNGRRLREIDLYTLDYTDAFDASDISMVEIAHQIMADRSFRSLLSNYNHIFILTHSLGGVITKKLLIDLSYFGMDASLSRILGVGLLGVPSSGAPLASYVSGSDGLQTIFGYFIADNPTLWDDLRSREYSDSLLDDIEAKWHDLVFDTSERGHSIFSACGHETKFEVNFLSVKIVPKLYSITACSNMSYPFSKKHTDLPKPTSPTLGQEETYKWLVRSLEEAFGHLDLIGVRHWNRADVPLGEMFQHIDLTSESREPRNGLPYLTTSVEFVDPTDQELFRRFFPWIPAGGYSAPTYAELLYTMSQESENSCMDVELDSRRRLARVSLGEYVECDSELGSRPEIACTPAACPENPLRFD